MTKLKKTNPDLWVHRGAPVPSGPVALKRSAAKTADDGMKRLQVYVPVKLHAKVKAQCAIDGRSINDVVLEWLESRFK